MGLIVVIEFAVELMSWNEIGRGLGFIQTFFPKVNYNNEYHFRVELSSSGREKKHELRGCQVSPRSGISKHL